LTAEPLRQRKVKKSSVFGHSILAEFDLLALEAAGPDAVDEPDEPLPKPVFTGSLTDPATTGDWPWPWANLRWARTLGLGKIGESLLVQDHHRNQGPYSQHFIFFVTYEWVQ
jgi:hypothetical protein